MWNDRRRLVFGLAGSLLLNMFLLGLVLGRGVAWHHRHPPSPGQPPLAAPRYVAALPEDQKAIFRAALTAHREAIRAARRSHRELRATTEADIAAPTFDRAKVAADLAALHQTNRAIEDATSAALLDALGKMTPEARAQLVGRPAP